MIKVDLFLLAGSLPGLSWPFGEVLEIPRADPADLAAEVDRWLPAASSSFALFWDADLGHPDLQLIAGLLRRNVDIWHSGLLIGMQGNPAILDFMHPTWMLNRDPSPEREATSWRVSLRACLVRTGVLRCLGFIRPDFLTLEAAALEWGYRCIQQGVLMRHLPDLLGRNKRQFPPLRLLLEEELRFFRLHFSRKWTLWALGRLVLTGRASLPVLWSAWRKTSEILPAAAARAYQEPHSEQPATAPELPMGQPPAVSVILPTLDRYPYLRTLLGQLRSQTLPPQEIIIVDQIPPTSRPPGFYAEFSDLPLRIIDQETPGQCSSRNAALQVSRGDYILFLDDDDEILPGLIEAHLANLRGFEADVSSGVAEVPGDGALPDAFQKIRVSDVFPTGNTLLRRSLLKRSGLFDLAYERNTSEDADLGMRVYLEGGLMVLDPSIRVLHHHAPRGGLRAHKARIVTYSSSRRSLLQRNLPSVSEIYLMHRYFSPRQVREGFFISVLGTFSLHAGGPVRRLLKGVIGVFSLPGTLRILRDRDRQALEMLRRFPQIPTLGSS